MLCKLFCPFSISCCTTLNSWPPIGRTRRCDLCIKVKLSLTLIHLVSIPVTNTSVNPARSTGPALIVGGAAITQLWLFWVAPLIGGILGGVIYRWLSDEPRGQVVGTST